MYSRQNRLTEEKDFFLVRKKGKRFDCPFFTAYLLKGKLENSIIGFIVSNKVGNAVERNKIKRKLRELFKIFLIEKNSFKLVVIGKRKVLTSKTDEINQFVEKSKNFLIF